MDPKTSAQILRRPSNDVVEAILEIQLEKVAEAAEEVATLRGALDEGLSQVRGLPLLAVSAKTGKGLDTMLKAAFEIRESWSKRVPTAALNRWFDDALEANPPPAPGGRRIKLRYAHQGGRRPPKIVIHGNQTARVNTDYKRYLSNRFREAFDLYATPVEILFKSGDNPFEGRRNTLTPRQERKRKRQVKRFGKNK